MYFKPQRKQKILDIADDYAHLREVKNNGDIEFELFYKVSQNDVVTNDTSVVRIQITSRNVTLKPLLDNVTSGVVDAKQLVKKLRTKSINDKGVIKQRKQYIVASKKSDVTSHINNEIVDQLRADVPTEKIWQNYETKLETVMASEVKNSAENKPVLSQVAHESIKNVQDVQEKASIERPAKLMQDMVTRQGIDPTYIFDLTNRTIPGVDLVGGMTRKQGVDEVQNSPANRLLNYYMFRQDTSSQQFNGQTDTNSVQDDQMIQVLVRVPSSKLEIPVTVTIPERSFRIDGKFNSQFSVKFDLINNKTGASIDTVTKTLDVSKYLKTINTPKIPPIVKLTKSDITSRAIIEIKQVDPGANSVRVYKKNVYVASTYVDGYTFVGTFDVKPGQTFLYQVNTPLSSTAIYRIIPSGKDGTQGFEFTNVVLKPNRYKPIKAVALVGQLTDTGIKLEVRKIPQGVVAIEFIGRNLTTHEKAYSNIGGDVILIDDSMRASDYVSITDRDVSPNNVYEYVVKLYYPSGTTELAGNVTLEFLKPAPGKVDTVVNNVRIDNENSDVVFNINTTIVDTNLDVVKVLLEKQGIFDQFKNDIEREREFLKNLIAHNVQRVNLDTGEREDFGVITTNEFSDAKFRKNQAIQPLRSNTQYRYEVMALLRTPETMFESFVKQKVDPITKKSYKYNPAKFQHPLALDRGIIVTSAGLKSRFTKSSMSYGTIGSVETVNVTFNGQTGKIIEQKAARFDRYINVITWKILGDIDFVDHFIIMKDVLGARTLIGKAHSEFIDGSCQYLHSVSRQDEGPIKYVIIPVFNNYESGAEAATNTIIVEKLPR